MKSIVKLGFAAVILASTMLSSCGKYEEGPAISFASKKGRLTGTWTVEKWIDASSGTEVICTSNCSVMELKKDGSMSQNGTSWGQQWALSNDKEKLEKIYGNVVTSEIILRLTSKELWVQDIGSGDQKHYKAN